MTYKDLETALKRTGIPFREGEWKRAENLKSDYGAYAIDNAEDLVSDGHHTERLWEGTVDLFCRNGPGYSQCAKVEAAMDSAGVYWQLNSRQYEEPTGLTHWEWVFRCLP